MRIAEQAHSRADIHPRMGDKNPVWLQETRELCRTSGIKIVGWGPDMLTVEAKSEERAREIASQLGELGFKAIKNEDDAYAGWLNLSKNPSAIEARIASFDISRRRWDEQIEPLIWALGTGTRSLHECGTLPTRRHSAVGSFIAGAVFLGRQAHLGMAARNASR